MTEPILKICLDDNTFHFLKRSVPELSQARAVLNSAEQVKFFDVVLTCTESQARNLLLYADGCPKAIAIISAILRKECERGESNARD
jgi:hypothetical protein